MHRHLRSTHEVPLCQNDFDWIARYYPEAFGAIYNDECRAFVYDFAESHIFMMLGQAAPTYTELRESWIVEDRMLWARDIHERVDQTLLKWDDKIDLPPNYTRTCEKMQDEMPYLWKRSLTSDVPHGERRKYALTDKALIQEKQYEKQLYWPPELLVSRHGQPVPEFRYIYRKHDRARAEYKAHILNVCTIVAKNGHFNTNNVKEEMEK